MRIGIVGTGISGMVAAYLLQRDHDLTVFEANDYVGGHTATIDVPVPDGTPTNRLKHANEAGSPSALAVDTGFIVYNERTYPNFVKLLDRLGVETQPSEMSFSVRDESDGMEYAGGSLTELFGGLNNALRPSHYRMLLDILRFYREAKSLLDESKEDDGLTLGSISSRAVIRDRSSINTSSRWSARFGRASPSACCNSLVAFLFAFFTTMA